MAINGIEITDVIIFPVKSVVDGQAIKAFARVILNDQFSINGVKILERLNDTLYIEFPRDGLNGDVCFPLTAELRNYITDQVVAQYSISAGVPVDHKVELKVTLNFSDSIDGDENAILDNVLDALVHQHSNVGIVSDTCESYTIKMVVENGDNIREWEGK